METSDNIARLLGIMAQLRDPESGCPWDLKQNFSTIVPHTIEEVYEVADAIASGDMQDIQEELGDLLFQVVFYAQLGKEQQAFDFDQVAGTIADKLVRRHPHVFSDTVLTDNASLQQNWNKIKKQEKQARGLADDPSVLADIPNGLAPLLRADKLQKRCAAIGFDWPDLPPVVDKIHEEVEEVIEEVNKCPQSPELIEEEVGDLLFAVVNLARHLSVDPDQALRKANNKFETRFRAVEQHFVQQKQDLCDASLQQMDSVWHHVKEQLKKEPL